MELRLPTPEQLRTIYDRDLKEAFPTVSYTHLTLPTKSKV